MILAALFGAAHFAVVGIPFILSRGGGESIAYLVFFLDYPLYIAGEGLFQRLLLNSVPFNFVWFVVLGTVMYGFLGYVVGRILVFGNRRQNAET